MKLTDLLLFCCFLGTSLITVTEARRIKKDPSPKATDISIEVINEDTASTLCIECWSASGQHNQQRCFTADTPSGIIAWNFQPNIFTVFWCSARWGLSHLTEFPVFGEGVPRVSSSWLIDGRGRRRTMEEGRPVNDFIQDWPGLSLTTTEEDWPSTTEEIPTTEDPIEITTEEPTTEEPTTEEPITEEPITEEPTTEELTTEETTTEEPTTEELTTEETTTEEPTTEELTTEETTTEEPTTEELTTEEPTTEEITTEDVTTEDPPTEEPTTEDGTTEEPTTRDPGEDFVCPSPVGNFPDPLDCSAYYACDGGVVVGHQYCPDGLYFNPALNNCDYPWNVDCPLKKLSKEL